jgi:hypothetical protein
MPSTVYFTDFRARSRDQNKTAKLQRLFDAAGFGDMLGKGTLTALKLHFGEMGTDCYLHPVLVRALVDACKARRAKPFLTDTNTLYAGSRHNAVDHLETAARHGFVPSVVDAPVLIADGLLGESAVRVPLPAGKHFREVLVAGAIHRAEAMLVLSHFKGHELAGFGGAVKNLAMGCAPFAGKREQHTPRFAVDQEACIACGECAEVCPEGAARVQGEAAVIDRDACIGCGECYIHCPEKAVQLDWKTEIPPFMERMTEYALGAVQGKQGRTGYVNFLMDVTPDCDCLPWSDTPIVPDIGMLASTDPVALDRASLDLVDRQAGLAHSHLSCNLECGRDKFGGLWSHTMGPRQLEYGQEIGLGDNEYELVTL